MKYCCLFAIIAVTAVPVFVSADYAPSGGPNYSGLDELVHAAAGGSGAASNGGVVANGEIQNTPAEAARLEQIQAQIQALNANPTYQNFKNSEAISESLAESNLASNIRSGNIDVVPPNLVDQGVFNTLLVPTGRNNHQVITTQPLPPIIINQPPSPPAHVSSGPASIVRAAPVIYKIKPSVIYQQEVINKVPTPLSLNPVYVKVYKPGNKVNAPTAPIVQPAYSAPGSYASSAPAYIPAAPSYAPAASSYPSASASYSAAPSPYPSAASYAPAAPASYSDGPSPYSY